MYTRLAPTPSGYLHLGNAVSFALTWAIARAQGAGVFLRIDDLDKDRVAQPYIEDIFYTLERMGLTWDKGPTGPDDLAARWSQRLRIPRYFECLEQMRALIDAPLYACSCTRSQLTEGRYNGHCRNKNLSFDEHPVWRFKVPAQAVTELQAITPDPVVRRREGLPAYHIASLCDDIDYGCDLIVRGEDLTESTQIQKMISTYIVGGAAFAKAMFIHHPLVLAPDGMKYSKSRKSPPLKELWSSKADVEKFYEKLSLAIGLNVAASSAVELSQALKNQPVNQIKSVNFITA